MANSLHEFNMQKLHFNQQKNQKKKTKPSKAKKQLAQKENARRENNYHLHDVQYAN